MDVLTLILFFFFNDTATTEIYTLSLHDALPISMERLAADGQLQVYRHHGFWRCMDTPKDRDELDELLSSGAFSRDRKSTRLNSSHANISYAVFCLKKKKKNETLLQTYVSLLDTH